MSIRSVLVSHVVIATAIPKPHIRHGVYAHWKRQAATVNKRLVTVCAWCPPAPFAAPPSPGISHGMCETCFIVLLEKEAAQ